VRLVRPSEQKAAARERAAATSGLRAKWLTAIEQTPKKPRKAIQREIAREMAIEAEERVYVLLECDHYTTKQDREFWNDGKHPGLWFCESCAYVGIPAWDCWRKPYPSPIYPSSDTSDIPPF
jgi:hypothetical protein